MDFSKFHQSRSNESAQLYEGEIQVEADWVVAAGQGEIILNWLPRPEITFRVAHPALKKAHNFIAEEQTLRIGIRWEGKWEFGEGILSGLDLRGDGMLSARLKKLKCGDGSALSEVEFRIPNFIDCIGEPINFGSKIVLGRIALESDEWRIVVDPTAYESERNKELDQAGGYGITHIGRLCRVDGQSFSGDAITSITEALYFFLSFARGRWTGPLLMAGTAENGHEWLNWESPALISPRAGSEFSWLPATQEAKALAAAWPGFLKLWLDDTWNETVRITLSQYIEAMTGGFVENKVVLGQTALELLSWTQLIEHDDAISRGGFEQLPASDRLSLLLARYNIPKQIPGELSALLAHAKANNLTDGPSAVTWVRNRVVHANKISKVLAADFRMRVEAMQLMFWYLELAILRLCDYKSNYHSQIAPLQMPTRVPWAS